MYDFCTECGGEGVTYAPGFGVRVCTCCNGTGFPNEDHTYDEDLVEAGVSDFDMGMEVSYV